MDWTQIIVGIVSSALVAVLGKLLNVQLDAEQRKKVDWAIEKGVAAAAERMRGAAFSGGDKQQAAIRTAESLAPAAMKKLSSEQKAVVVDAAYARLRPGLPTAFVLGASELPHATDDLGSRPPPKEPPS